ncbi:ParA family protein [Roseovarius salinarum]|uniref:ParA family protein n=1 Tax=Roseovarius salinarum TaxID=1981892 RepID=UPI000C34F6B9|nr:ParA family protein [Roseovarius salinarum]
MKTILVANPKGGTGKTVTAVTVAAALAARGDRVALADADRQKSALRWLKRRPEDAAPIKRRDWSASTAVGDAPKKADWLVVDSPGSLNRGGAKDLVAEATLVLVPLTPSWIDEDSTRRFLKKLREIKRVRKGKADIRVIANRVRPRSRAFEALADALAGMGEPPLACISERAAYGELARNGLSVFDRTQKPYREMQAQWQPILALLDAEAG